MKVLVKKTQVLHKYNSYTHIPPNSVVLEIHLTILNTMISDIGQVGSLKKEKPVSSTSSAPAPAPAPQHSDGKDLLEDLTSERPSSPRESNTPKQEAEVELEACDTEEKQDAHTGTLTPKPEVRMFNDWSSIREENNLQPCCNVVLE